MDMMVGSSAAGWPPLPPAVSPAAGAAGRQVESSLDGARFHCLAAPEMVGSPKAQRGMGIIHGRPRAAHRVRGAEFHRSCG